MASVAVIIPLPFTTFLREVEWIDFLLLRLSLLLTAFIGTTDVSFTFFRLFLSDLLSISLDE
jgi:hypothetical protein